MTEQVVLPGQRRKAGVGDKVIIYHQHRTLGKDFPVAVVTIERVTKRAAFFRMLRRNGLPVERHLRRRNAVAATDDEVRQAVEAMEQLHPAVPPNAHGPTWKLAKKLHATRLTAWASMPIWQLAKIQKWIEEAVQTANEGNEP